MAMHDATERSVTTTTRDENHIPRLLNDLYIA